VDGVTFKRIDASSVEVWLVGLREELISKTYRPDPVRRVAIPKPGGGERPRGIPTIRDRVVQTATKIVLEPIFEADFEGAPLGHNRRHPRPKRANCATTDPRNRYCVSAKCFDTFCLSFAPISSQGLVIVLELTYHAVDVSGHLAPIMQRFNGYAVHASAPA
jgi:hypothetical protein